MCLHSMYSNTCVFVLEPLNGTFHLTVKGNIQLMFVNEILVGVMAALTHHEGPEYVPVRFNQVVLKDCIILSYVSEQCSIMFLVFFLLHPALL